MHRSDSDHATEARSRFVSIDESFTNRNGCCKRGKMIGIVYQSCSSVGINPMKQKAVIVLLCALTGWSFASPLTIYDQPNLGGTGVAVSDTNTVYKGQSGIPGGLNNKISSFQLEQGYMAYVADPSDGMHPGRIYIAADAPLTVNTLPAELDNSVSFIYVVTWRPVQKKGKAGFFNDPPINTSWFYAWNKRVDYGQDPSHPYGVHAAMAWGVYHTDPADIADYLSMDQVDHLLSFNEPDHCNAQSGAQGNLCDIPTAVSKHELLQKTGLRLGSPASHEEGANNVNGWTSQFIQQCDAAGIRVDYAVLHWYDWGGNPSGTPNEDPALVLRRFKKYVSHAYHMYRRPIWITEFNANPNRVTSVQDAFLQKAMEWLDAVGYVERYAWYQPNGGNGNFFDFGTTTNLTSTGQIYYDNNSTPAYVVTDLPAGLTRTDIGSPSQTGIALHANGTYTLGGNGEGVGGTNDQACFVYEQVNGDCEIVARVFDVLWRHRDAQGGIMIRETLDAGSKQASMLLTPGNGSLFTCRGTDNGSSTSVTNGAISAPYWVKLTRAGDVLTAYTSPDGASWTLQGSQTINMNADVYVGLVTGNPGSSWESDSIFTDVTINVGTQNNNPVFTADPINRPDAVEGAAYSNSIADSATDVDNDMLIYSKVSGPDWLNISTNGVLSGTPAHVDLGTNIWTVQVIDGNEGSDAAMLYIAVAAAQGGNLPLTIATTGTGELQVDFLTQNEAQYQVLYTTSLTNDVWTLLETVVGDGNTNSIFFSATNGPSMFFKVVVP